MFFGGFETCFTELVVEYAMKGAAAPHPSRRREELEMLVPCAGARESRVMTE
jgi:hypothetical protein